jgi:hypothetical protein
MISSEIHLCDCWAIHWKKMLDLVYYEVSYDFESVILPDGEFCLKCKKPVSEKDLKMQTDLRLIYGDL